MDRNSENSSDFESESTGSFDLVIAPTPAKRRQINGHSWMRSLRFPMYSVAKLRKLRVGERLWVGFLSGPDVIKGAAGHCEAYFDRIRGGWTLSVACTLCLPGQRVQRPGTEALIAFKLLPGGLIDFGEDCDQTAQKDALRICRYLSYFDRHAKDYGFERWLKDPEFRSALWREVCMNNKGFNWRLGYGPTPRGLADAKPAPQAPAELLIDVSEGRGRKNLFGRPELANVYRRARDLIVKNKVFRFVDVTESNGVKTITICNLWRVERYPDASVRTFEFSLADQSWAEVVALNWWPDIPFCPVMKTQSLDWWMNVARRCIWNALYAAGYDLIPRPSPLTSSGDGKKIMTAWSMANLLLQKYLGRRTGTDEKGKEIYKYGFLKPEIMLGGARALRAVIYDHIADREILSAILAIDYRPYALRDYLMYARDPRGLLRVSRERRNLLPMLPQISPAYWNREDLFSRELWVRNGRKRTLVDYKKFSDTPFYGNGGKTFSSFSSKAAFRWLCRAPLTAIRRWAGGNGRRDITALENLSRVNVDMKVPAAVWCALVEYRGSVAALGVGEGVQRLYRLFILHCVAMWKKEGYQALRQWLWANSDRLGDVADWLAAEGLAQAQPDRNATWASLHRRSVDWHERVAVANYENGQSDNRSWDSLVPEFEFEGVVITPLNSTKEVALEGYRQHHCVGGYAPGCNEGTYRVYTMIEQDGIRSTLGLWLTKEGRWAIDQHRGKYNDHVSETAQRAGLHVLACYQAEYRKSVEEGKGETLHAKEN